MADTTHNTLATTLDDLVALARHLRATPDDVPSRLPRLEELHRMLTYFSTPTEVGGSVLTTSQPPIGSLTHCAFHSCAHTWRDYDACLLNFAPRDEPPLWLCRDHHPPLSDGGIRPPGWQPDTPTRSELESARKSALARLSRDELRTVNPRVGG